MPNETALGDSATNKVITQAAAPRVKIKNVKSNIDMRIKVFGWCDSIQRQDPDLTFIIFRDGTGYLKCKIFGDLNLKQDIIELLPETSMALYGVIQHVSQCQDASGDVELLVDEFTVIGKAPENGIASLVAQMQDMKQKLDNRHLLIRTTQTSNILKLIAMLSETFHDFYYDKGYYEVILPSSTQLQSNLKREPFRFYHLGFPGFLSQSNQFYLEACIASLGNCYSMARSYHATETRSWRHLAEFVHIEAEMPFIQFEDLLLRIEEMVMVVLGRFMKRSGDLFPEVNPNFVLPKRPFRRLQYRAALELMKKLGIRKKNNLDYQFGDAIQEDAERSLIDHLNEPILLTHLPATLKAFYMRSDKTDSTVTESVDLLMPGFGEIMSGSMRIHNLKELKDSYNKERFINKNYYWYTDLRKYGTCSHGGYSLGLERFATWLLGQKHITDVCLYPRFIGRCKP